MEFIYLLKPTHPRHGSEMAARMSPTFNVAMNRLTTIRGRYRSVRGEKPLSHASFPPNQKWHIDQRRINEAGKCIRENTAFLTVLRDVVRVQLCHAAV